MATFVGTIFLVLIVTVIGVTLFGFWAAGLVFRGIFRGARWALGGQPQAPLRSTGQLNAMTGRICPNSRCMQCNPRTAQYCKRCGRPISPAAMQSSAASPAAAQDWYNRRAAPPPGWV